MDKFDSALAQHAALLTRASTGAISSLLSVFDKQTNGMLTQFLSMLSELTDSERTALAAGNYRTPALREIRDLFAAWHDTLGTSIVDLFAEQAEALAASEAAYISKLMKVSAMPIVAPLAAGKVIKAAQAKPVTGGLLVSEMMSRHSTKAQEIILQRTRQGITDGLTNEQIIRSIRGTKAVNYTDGALNIAKRELDVDVRTIRNHIGNTAFDETYKEAGVSYVQLVATLDGRTSKTCASLDGKRYRIDEPHPIPPLHPNCRSVLRPIFELDEVLQSNRPSNGDERGVVSANVNFDKWLKQQSSDFQREWLGATRYKLWKNGKYPLDRFTDPLGKQYTLEQLRQRDEQTFKDLFG